MLHTQRSSYLLKPFPSKLPLRTQSLCTISSLLNLCKKPQHLQQIHARFILHGLHQNPTLSSKLVESYASLGLLNFSLQLFNSIANPSSLLYSTVLRSLETASEYERTILVYQEMVIKAIYPDGETYPFVLKACCCSLDVRCGKKVHGQVVKLGFDSFDLVGDALVAMCRGFGDLENEQKVIDRKHVRDSNYWNSLIFKASRNGNIEDGVRVLERMRIENLETNSVTMINMLRLSVDLDSLNAGRAIHCLVLVNSLSKDLSVNTALLSMYSKLGSLKDARLLFEVMPEKDCVVWNIMISAYSQHGKPREALDQLRCMANLRVRTDLFTAIPAISSIRQLKTIEWGKQMHAHVMRNGSDCQVSVHNSLIDMYCECACLNYARTIFDSLTKKTVVSWSSMIKGYVTRDQNLDALSLFSKMKLDGIKIDFVTVINILPACVNLGALEQVRHIHGYSVRFGLDSLTSVNSALLNSYAKCGCIEMARKLFDEERIDGKDIITWNSMLSAYAKHGSWSQCFKLFSQMKQSNLKLDQVTFLAMLTASVNSGLVEEGRQIFREMRELYGCQPSQEHYACLVDLLGRAGHTNEARELVTDMPMKPDARVWGPLLSASKLHSDTKLAEFAAEKLITMEPENAGNYVLLSNIYAAAGKWDKFANMRRLIRERGLKKTPGCSWLEIDGYVHEFLVADRSHPKANAIYALLRILEFEIKDTRDEVARKVS